ncbi:MAG: DUF4388 domain-containing protein [Acidimicrobiales bacterium]
MTAPPAALRGTLDEFPIATLLRFLAAGRRSGLLTVAGAPGALVGLVHGAVCAATTSDLDALRDELVASGVVGAPGWRAAVAAGEALGDALVQVGGADHEALEAALYDHTVTTVFELLLPGGPAFAFEPGAGHPLGCRRPVDVETVLADASERLRAWRAIAETIPSTSVVVRARRELPAGLASVTIARDAWRVLAAVDGRRTVAEVIAEVGLSAFGVCAVLHELVQAGALEVLSAAAPPSA